MNLLLVEDDAETVDYLKRALVNAGHKVDHAAAGDAGLRLASDRPYDVILLDRLLPAIDGLSIVRTIRAAQVRTPVLMLTALGDLDERVRGLDAGADDYLAKPFAFVELQARMNALARRAAPAASQTAFEVDDLRVDLLLRKATRAGRRLDLNPREFQLLEYLVRHAGQIVTRKMIIENVWGYKFEPRTNIVETHMSRLRAKVDRDSGRQMIQTVRGAGYVIHESKE